MPRSVVIDACCGCGGNAIAFAAAGLRVHAIDNDDSRLELARRNAYDLGLIDRLTFHLGDGVEIAEQLLVREPGSSLFLDLPWGGPEGASKPSRWEGLLGPFGPLAVAAPIVMLKLPRGFELDTLPGGPSAWRLRYGFGDGDARGVVKLITAWKC